MFSLAKSSHASSMFLGVNLDFSIMVSRLPGAKGFLKPILLNTIFLASSIFMGLILTFLSPTMPRRLSLRLSSSVVGDARTTDLTIWLSKFLFMASPSIGGSLCASSTRSMTFLSFWSTLPRIPVFSLTSLSMFSFSISSCFMPAVFK